LGIYYAKLHGTANKVKIIKILGLSNITLQHSKSPKKSMMKA
jgi:hypothetical protein